MPSKNGDTAPASQRQINYLRDLATLVAVFGPEHDRTATLAQMEAFLNANPTSDKASDLIDQAKRASRHPENQIPASDWQIKRSRELAAEYALFGLTLDVEETIARVEALINGDFFSSEAARELARLSYKAAPHPTAQTPLRLTDVEGIENLNVSEGHYAVFDDKDVLRYYRIYTPTTGANKGVGVIRRFAGDSLLGLYPSEAKVVLETIDSDPDAAAYRFSDTFARCWVCGKNLTDAVSRLISVGPTCRGFANHSGLRSAANDVDHNPERRYVYRALREWAIAQGFRDPRNAKERESKQMTASRVASAWSGIPGILPLGPEDAVAIVSETLTGEMTKETEDLIRDGLLSAPTDTLLILIESKVLSAPVMEVLSDHPKKAVKDATAEFFLAQLGGGF